MQSKYVITKWYICSPDLLEAKKHFVWCLFFTVFLEKKLHSHSWPFMLHSTNCKANLMCNSLAWISLSLCSLLLFLIKFYAWHSFMAYSRRQKINKSKLTKNTPKKKNFKEFLYVSSDEGWILSSLPGPLCCSDTWKSQRSLVIGIPCLIQEKKFSRFKVGWFSYSKLHSSPCSADIWWSCTVW